MKGKQGLTTGFARYEVGGAKVGALRGVTLCCQDDLRDEARLINREDECELREWDAAEFEDEV